MSSSVCEMALCFSHMPWHSEHVGDIPFGCEACGGKMCGCDLCKCEVFECGVERKSEVWSVQSVRVVECGGEGGNSGYSSRGSRFNRTFICLAKWDKQTNMLQ